MDPLRTTRMLQSVIRDACATARSRFLRGKITTQFLEGTANRAFRAAARFNNCVYPIAIHVVSQRLLCRFLSIPGAPPQPPSTVGGAIGLRSSKRLVNIAITRPPIGRKRQHHCSDTSASAAQRVSVYREQTHPDVARQLIR